jgi:iron(III) transport system substrate-binding protein
MSWLLTLRAPEQRLVFGLMLLAVLLILVPSLAAATAKSDWQPEWERAVGAAEKEGQVTIYGPPGHTYQNALGAFQEGFPKIKILYVPGSGTNNAQRLVTERRAGKFLADIFVGGSGTLIEVLYDGNLLDPIPPLIILPEVKDPAGWYNETHTYADVKGQYVFMMQGNVNTNLAAYNTKLAKPDGLNSYLDLLNPKWKGKMVAYDPRVRGHVPSVRNIYYNPKLGGEFFRRFFGEMDVTISRDQRLMIDGVAQGKFLLSVFSSNSDVQDARRKGLPVDLIDAPDDESYMSGGFGFVAVVNKAPHPHAAKVFLNWLLSKQGQLKWQEKSDNNSLRTDIPKDMLSDPTAVPKEKGRYMNMSLPQYQDIDPALKIIADAIGRSAKN